MANKIPEILKNLKFCRVKFQTKIPFEKEWPTKPYSYEDILKFPNENYGILCGAEGIAVIDCDENELSQLVEKELPKTFAVKTGGGGSHYYYFIPELKRKMILVGGNKHLGEVQSIGQQVVGPGCIHPNGNKYEIINDIPISKLDPEKLVEVIGKFVQKEEQEKKQEKLGGLTEEIATSVKFSELLKGYGLIESDGNWNCPFHKSIGGKCLSIDDVKGIFNCFHCKRKGNIISFVSQLEGITIKESIDKLKKMGNIENPQKIKTGDVFTTKHQSEELNKIKPFFYDKNRLFWLWNDKTYCWEFTDDIDILNMIEDTTQRDIITQKSRQEIINALKSVGRRNMPKEPPKSWVQFKDKIMDIKTGDIFYATSKYFITNPIPWSMGKIDKTPNIDRIFEEWVGKDYVKTLKEVLAYCVLTYMPIHRIICLDGDGSNGKGSFLRLVEKFIGQKNVVASNIDKLTFRNFETSKLFKKLVCIIGEIGKEIFKRTDTLKMITGDDLMGIEMKQKAPFDTHNYALPIIATNKVPKTTDNTAGFFRRWTIIRFSKTFNESTDILKQIPDKEYENFCNQIPDLINGIINSGMFTNDGTVEERKERYLSASSPVKEFLDEHCIIGADFENSFVDLYREYVSFLSANNYSNESNRIFGKGLNDRGFNRFNKTIENQYGRTTEHWRKGLKLKEE